MNTARKQKIKTTTYKFPVIIEKDEDGFFVADCPELQGCHTQGRTIEEAITNIRDAIKLHLKILTADKQEFPKLEPVSLTSLEIAI
jgi:predicted RNase H-like HicB family nuclease